MINGEISDIIKGFQNKATLDTKISALKVANESENFQNVLASVINASFEQGIFPQTLKLAKVVPIHKGGSKTEVKNYRPISLLPTFSKIFEKTMHVRISNFMESNNSLFETQFGFRKGRSCEHALLTAQNELLSSLSKKEIALLLLIDFSKAFDMVDHDILLKKLYKYGIRGNALNWMQSYLQGRQQYVTIGGSVSTKMPIIYGVPQGSILGPLLFIIYINDLPNIYKLAKFILYADDANIIITGKDVNDIKSKVDELATALTSWVDCNGLKLNLDKTNYMIFSNNRLHSEHDYNIKIANRYIKRTDSTKFLGVIINEKLNWNQHIAAIKQKMSRHIGIMYKLKGIIPLSARLSIYHSFVQSHLNYCSLIWGFSTKSNINSIFAIQKKGIRAIIPGFVNYFYKEGKIPHHTKSAFTEYNILTIHSIVVKNALLYLYRCYRLHYNHFLPSSVRKLIPASAPKINATHETNTEWYELYSTGNYAKSIFYKGPLLFTDIVDNELLRSDTYLAFRNSVKNILLGIQSAGESEEWLPDNFKLFNIRGLRHSPRNNNM